ncbi:Hypothetical predicted protein [Lecanosticta acicola]|uniref:Uncharacterized protein n=1 Tax=Lecanosticta acicola TaxID=111012 RepID=A0AAI9ECE4_9PEZI|nr:Hypothetical predicted protein [Lecanosticta acicola]
MAPQVVTVYTRTTDGQLHEVGKVELHKINQLSPRVCKNLRGSSGKTVVLDESEFDRDASKWILAWMNRYDLKKAIDADGQQMLVKDLKTPLGKKDAKGEPEFPDIVKVFATSYAFGIPVPVKGTDFHDKIYEYIHMGALTADEFRMLFEWLQLSKNDLLKTAVHQTAYLNGSGKASPEIEEIENAAKEFGVLEELQGRTAHHAANKKRQDAAKAAYDARQAREAA